MTVSPLQESQADLVLAEHRELQELLGALQHYTATPRPEIGVEGFHRWAAALSRSLVDLHDKLFRHFHHESTSGLFEELERAYPRAGKLVQKLQGQHPRLLQDVRELIHSSLCYSQGEAPANPRLRRRLHDILSRLSIHEERESELLVRLKSRDIGEVD